MNEDTWSRSPGGRKIWDQSHSYSPTRGLSFAARGPCRWERTPGRIPPSWHPNRRSPRNVVRGCWTPHCQESCPTDGGVPLWLAAIQSDLQTQNAMMNCQITGYWLLEWTHLRPPPYSINMWPKHLLATYIFEGQNWKTKKKMSSLEANDFRICIETTTGRPDRPTDRPSKPFLRGRHLQQLLNIFSIFYETRRFLTVFARTLLQSLSWATTIQFIPFHHISLKSILISSSQAHFKKCIMYLDQVLHFTVYHMNMY